VNRRIAVIDVSNGSIVRQWGAYGKAPDDTDIGRYDPAAPPAQQFRTPHCVEPSTDGMLYVCDRGNNRIQVFRKDGTFVKEKVIAPNTRGDGSVWDIAFSRDAQQRFLYVADGMNQRVHVLDRQSLEHLTSFGAGGRYPGHFYSIHNIAVDSRGNIYTGESLQGKRIQKFVFKGIGSVTKKDQGPLWPAR
jgi:DNA-binding beta-propeller fold protein YncE